MSTYLVCISLSLRSIPSSQHAAPITDDIGLRYENVRFNSTLFSSTKYRENASVEVDAAWEELGTSCKPKFHQCFHSTTYMSQVKFIIVSDDVAIDAGIPAKNAKLTPKNGHDRYAAGVEVFHHLHCLNLLRKAAWFNYPYYSALRQDEFSTRGILMSHVGS